MAILLFIVILLVLVLAHEWGHFIAARKAGAKVEEFGFGFPPRIVGKEYNGTFYSLNWLPLGGFVKIRGEDGSGRNDPKSFAFQPAWKRAIILVAGVVMNLVVAGAFFSVGYIVGSPSVIDASTSSTATVHDPRVYIVDVKGGSPADAAGIESGDSILALDGMPVTTTQQIQQYTIDHADTTISIGIDRSGEERTITAIPTFDEDLGRPVFGFSLTETAIVSYPWTLAIPYGFRDMGIYAWEILKAFGGLLWDIVTTGTVAPDLSGPVGIAIVTGKIAKQGIAYIIQFAGLLSINLAVLNIIPIPALDGGRLLFLLIEKLRRKAMSPKAESIANTIGFAFIILGILAITFRDVRNLFMS